MNPIRADEWRVDSRMAATVPESDRQGNYQSTEVGTVYIAASSRNRASPLS